MGLEILLFLQIVNATGLKIRPANPDSLNIGLSIALSQTPTTYISFSLFYLFYH